MDRNDIADNPLVRILNDKDADPTILTLSLIEEITKNFTCGEIGRGGFAVVYKGLLGKGRTVAVKKLSNHNDLDDKAYNQEVLSLMKVKHDNIVRFLGYCADTQGQVLDYQRTLVMADQRNRLLCFEYVPNGSLDGFIADVPGALDWRKRYKIIKGICAGLHYLHEKNILHLDLKPANILLNDKMMPKITDFGLARCFTEKQSHATTSKRSGTLGYLAPESFNDKVTITKKWDMYSLGVIIAEILTGERSGHFDVQDVLALWREIFETLSLSNTDVLLEQVRVCAEISMECLDRDPAKRPGTQCIMEKLCETADEFSQELLQIYPFALRFPFERYKEICCHVNLTNQTDSKVYFAIVPRNPEKYAGAEGLKGVVLPHSTQAVCVTMLKQQSRPPKMDMFHILISTSRSMKHGAGLVVEETLMAFISEPPNTAPPTIIKKEAIYDDNVFGQVESMDMHPTEPWIVTIHSQGYICIWKMKAAQRRNIISFAARNVPPAINIEKLFIKNTGSAKFTSVKFIPRTQCIVAGDSSGFIHIYTYIDNQLVQVTNDRAHRSPVTSLAVHPTHHYMLSSSDTEIKRRVWDDNKGWVCVREWSLGARQVLFNPKSTETMAIVLNNPKKSETNKSIAIWSASNPEMDFPSGNSSQSTCVAYYLPSGRDTQYLVIGHSDGHTEILDGRSNKHLHALKVAMSGCVVAVACHPTLPFLVTGTKDGNVYLWNITTYRLTQTISFEHGTVIGFGFIDQQGFKRLVIAFSKTIEAVELD